MPVTSDVQQHRPKLGPHLTGLCPDGPLVLNSDPQLIARKVGKKERESKPAAQAAVEKERKRLEAVPVWDTTQVYSWSALAANARKTGKRVLVGDLMQLCLKNTASSLMATPRKS